MKAPLESTREDRLEMHREKMRNKVGRRLRWYGEFTARHVRRRKPLPQHKGLREIARRQRQAKRLHEGYMMNGGFSRRGNEGAGL